MKTPDTTFTTYKITPQRPGMEGKWQALRFDRLYDLTGHALHRFPAPDYQSEADNAERQEVADAVAGLFDTLSTSRTEALGHLLPDSDSDEDTAVPRTLLDTSLARQSASELLDAYENAIGSKVDQTMPPQMLPALEDTLIVELRQPYKGCVMVVFHRGAEHSGFAFSQSMSYRSTGPDIDEKDENADINWLSVPPHRARQLMLTTMHVMASSINKLAPDWKTIDREHIHHDRGLDRLQLDEARVKNKVENLLINVQDQDDEIWSGITPAQKHTQLTALRSASLWATTLTRLHEQQPDSYDKAVTAIRRILRFIGDGSRDRRTMQEILRYYEWLQQKESPSQIRQVYDFFTAQPEVKNMIDDVALLTYPRPFSTILFEALPEFGDFLGDGEEAEIDDWTITQQIDPRHKIATHMVLDKDGFQAALDTMSTAREDTWKYLVRQTLDTAAFSLIYEGRRDDQRRPHDGSLTYFEVARQAGGGGIEVIYGKNGELASIEPGRWVVTGEAGPHLLSSGGKYYARKKEHTRPVLKRSSVVAPVNVLIEQETDDIVQVLFLDDKRHVNLAYNVPTHLNAGSFTNNAIESRDLSYFSMREPDQTQS